MAKDTIVNELFESMDIEKDQKIALTEAFEKAVIKKTSELMEEYVETQVNEKVEILEEEYKEKVESLTESLDGYLDTVVEDFVAENAPTYEAQIEEEKTKSLLEMFDKMVTIAGVKMIDIKEAKSDYDSENNLQSKLDESNEKLSEMAEKVVEAKRESDKYLKLGMVAELASDLTILEKAKFTKLADMIPFEKNSSYIEKLETLKESITSQRSEDFDDTKTSLPENAWKQPDQVSAKDALDFGKYI